MENKMQGIAVLLICVAGIVGLVLGIFWCIWSLWCFVLPQIWEAGPHNFIQPNYWLFVGMWILASWIGQAIFGRGERKEEE